MSNHGGAAAQRPGEEQIRPQISATVLANAVIYGCISTWGALSGLIMNFANEDRPL